MQELAKHSQEPQSFDLHEQPRAPRRHRPSPIATRSFEPAPLSFDSSATADPQQLAMLMHDIRNLVAALELFSDLLDEPGVLHPRFRHYAGELRQVVSASGRLLNRMRPGSMPHTGSNDTSLHPAVPFHPTPRAVSSLPRPAWPRLLSPATPVESLAQELAANRNLLTALAGPGITLGMSVGGGRHPVAMTGDDLTRVLVNLVKNAAEAMPHGGHMQIGLEELGSRLHLTVEDSGPGIPETALPHIFTAGYTTHVPLDSEDRESEDSDPLAELWTTPGRGLGLAIVHSLVTAAGGRVWAANRNRHGALGQPATSNQPVALRPQAFVRDGHNWSEPTGARIHIELPIVPSSLAVT